jgi:hypothetical protein
MHIDEIHLEPKRRLYNKTKMRAVVAQAVVDLGEARTRKKLVEYVKQRTGVRISNSDADKLVNEIKIQARFLNITLDLAARQSCAINTQFLVAGFEPKTIAKKMREAGIGNLPGAVAIAEMLDQCRRAPGAQRAGP